MRKFRSVAFAVACASIVSVAGAQPDDSADAKSDEPAAGGEDQARTLYEEGDSAYRAGRYEEAIDRFSKAYELSKRPELQFNLANAYERLGQLAAAIRSLETYQVAAPVGERADIQRRIDALKKRLEKAEKGPAAPAPSGSGSEGSSGSSSDGSGTGSGTGSATAGGAVGGDTGGTGSSPVAGYVLLGFGGASLITGAVLGLLARGAHSDAEEKCDGGFCLAGAEDDLDREKGLALGADIGLGLGAVLSVVGLTLVLTHDSGSTASASRPSTALNFAPRQGGGALSFTGVF